MKKIGITSKNHLLKCYDCFLKCALYAEVISPTSPPPFRSESSLLAFFADILFPHSTKNVPAGRFRCREENKKRLICCKSLRFSPFWLHFRYTILNEFSSILSSLLTSIPTQLLNFHETQIVEILDSAAENFISFESPFEIFKFSVSLLNNNVQAYAAEFEIERKRKNTRRYNLTCTWMTFV